MLKHNDIKTLFTLNTLESALDNVEIIYDEAIACSYGEQFVTYRTLIEQINIYKNWINSMLPRKTVLIKTESGISNLYLMLGAILADAVPLFCDPVWKESEILKTLELNQCNYFICKDPLNKLSMISECIGGLGIYKLYEIKNESFNKNTVQVRSDTAFCRFTSGTTGFSRCLQFTENNFMNAACNWWSASKYQVNDTIYCLAGFNNGLAFNTSLLACFFSGAKLIIHKGNLVPSILKKTIEKHCPTVMVAFPFVYDMLVTSEKISKEQLSVRLAVSSAAPLSSETYILFKQKFGVDICNYYGLAEVGPCTFNIGDSNSLGKTLENVLIRTDETGRVQIKTNSMASAFLDNIGDDFNSSLTEDGFYITKDVGVIDSNGVLVLNGRVGRIINAYGRKIDPVEIEKLLESDCNVEKALVFSDEQLGRTILIACVEGKNAIRENLMKLCIDNLAPYKIPQILIIMENFPRSNNGKISIGMLQSKLT